MKLKSLMAYPNNEVILNAKELYSMTYMDFQNILNTNSSVMAKTTN